MTRTVRHRIVAFEGFEADLNTGVLRRGGIRVPLQDKVSRLLLMLLDSPGEIVSRDQLRRSLWPEGTFVDFDHNINNAVAKLRRTLTQAGGSGDLIETHGRRGYRLEVSPQPRPLTSRPSGAPERVKVAVLPLAPLDGGPDEQYLADGITEQLISSLGACCPERLGVIARTSVLKYAGTLRSVAQIGRDLRVPLVLEGTVQLIGGRAHIALQLIQTCEQTQLWSCQFDYPADHPLRIQQSVARKSVPCVLKVALRKTASVPN